MNAFINKLKQDIKTMPENLPNYKFGNLYILNSKYKHSAYTLCVHD